MSARDDQLSCGYFCERTLEAQSGRRVEPTSWLAPSSTGKVALTCEGSASPRAPLATGMRMAFASLTDAAAVAVSVAVHRSLAVFVDSFLSVSQFASYRRRQLPQRSTRYDRTPSPPCLALSLPACLHVPLEAGTVVAAAAAASKIKLNLTSHRGRFVCHSLSRFVVLPSTRQLRRRRDSFTSLHAAVTLVLRAAVSGHRPSHQLGSISSSRHFDLHLDFLPFTSTLSFQLSGCLIYLPFCQFHCIIFVSSRGPWPNRCRPSQDPRQVARLAKNTCPKRQVACALPGLAQLHSLLALRLSFCFHYDLCESGISLCESFLSAAHPSLQSVP